MPSSIPLPQLKLGKRKERSQMWEMFTDDGRCIDLELPVLTGCCDDMNHGKGFLLDPKNQYTNEQGYWVQVGWDRSLMPCCMIEATAILGTQNQKGTEDDDGLITNLVDQVFHEAKEATQEKLWEGIARNLLLDKLTWFIAIPCITALVAFGIIAIKN